MRADNAGTWGTAWAPQRQSSQRRTRQDVSSHCAFRTNGHVVSLCCSNANLSAAPARLHSSCFDLRQCDVPTRLSRRASRPNCSTVFAPCLFLLFVPCLLYFSRTFSLFARFFLIFGVFVFLCSFWFGRLRYSTFPALFLFARPSVPNRKE